MPGTHSFSVPAGQTSGKYLYAHNNSTPLSLGTFGAGLSAFTALNNLPATYFPPPAFSIFDTFQPLSAYIIINSQTINIVNNDTGVFPATYVLRPGLNMVTVDRNALSTYITDAFIINGVDQKNKIRSIYGTYDGTDDNANKAPAQAGLRFAVYGTFLPDLPFGVQNSITTFKPGSSYLVSMKDGETITFQYARRNQYIITDAGNTPPTGPNNIICCENGDRLTTGVEG